MVFESSPHEYIFNIDLSKKISIENIQTFHMFMSQVNGFSLSTLKIDLTDHCDSHYTDECIQRQLIYRASFTLSILFLVLAFLSGFSESINRNYWVMKFFIAVVGFVSLFWVGNDIFNVWAEIARIISFIWLLIQGLLLIDLFHDIHGNNLMAKSFSSLLITLSYTSKMLLWSKLMNTKQSMVMPDFGMVYTSSYQQLE
jgi:hypothetical protein